MPLYDYRCEDCSHELEALQNRDDDPLVTCPQCEQDALKKQVSAPAFTFKGSGWHKDLYGSPAPKEDKAASSESASDKKSTTETTSTSSKTKDKSA